jgi:hypothetical protein
MYLYHEVGYLMAKVSLINIEFIKDILTMR